MRGDLAHHVRRLALPCGMAVLAALAVATPAAAGAPAVSISPGSFDYGTVAVGTQTSAQSFVLTNTGTADLHVQGITFTGANPGDFRVYIGGCDYHTVSPGATCTEWAVFAPKEAGALTAAMGFPDDAAGSPQTVSLSGHGTGPVVAYAPASLDFPQVPLGQQSAPQTFYVKNVGDSALVISSAAPLNSFGANLAILSDGCSGNSIPAGGNCRMIVALTATRAVSGGTDVRFQANTNPSFQDYFMSYSGFGIYAQTYFPAGSFGNQPQNSTSQPQYVQLANGVGVPMHVSSVSLSGAGASQFAITSDNCTGATVEGDACRVYLTFTPTTTGQTSAQLSFYDDAPDSPQVTTLFGTGVAPGVVLSTTAIDFGIVSDSGSGVSQSVQLSNPTGSPLHLTSASITAGGSFFHTSADSCTGTTVQPGGSCSVTVTFAPTFAYAGFTGTLAFTDDAPGQQAVSLAGQGVDPQISYSPEQVNFGNQRTTTKSAAQTFTITNTGSTTWTPQAVRLEANNSGVFSIDASGCTQALAPGASCQALLYFTPTGMGTFTALMDAYDPVTGSLSKVPVTGTGVAPTIPTTSGFIFGNVRVGTSFSAFAVGLANGGTDTLHISSLSITGPNASAFTIGANSCAGAAISPGNGCDVPVSFSPSATGIYSATLNVVDDAFSGPSQFALTGTGVQSHATFSPASISFPNTLTGQSASRSVSVMSDGTASINLSSVSLSGTGAGAYSVSSDGCTGQQVPATIACALTVTFAPQATGSYPASVLVADDAPGSPQSISLSGTDQPADASASPASISFGALRPGQAAAPQTVTLTNDGSATLHMTSASLAGDPSFGVAADSCTGATLNAGATCTVQVGFSPQSLGSLQATLSFSDDASNSPQLVTLTGSGIQPAVSLSASSLAFGNQLVGTVSSTQAVVLTNSGTDTLHVGAASLAAPFGIVSDTCSNASLPAGSSCTVQTDFAPTTTGPASGTLSIPDDAPGSPHTVSLSGTGINPHATASPSSVAFGNVRAGTSAPPATVTLTNDGSTPIHLGTTTITGESIFTLAADTCSGTTLPVGAACTVQIGFSPTSTSAPYQLATLAFNDDAANTPQTVAISGAVVQPAVSLSASTLAFGNQTVGTTSASQSVTVTNSGSDTLHIAQATTAAPFAITGDACSNTALAAGATCTIQIAFAPAVMGPASGALSIADDAAGSPQTVALSGTGLLAHAGASPATISFGGVRPGKSGTAQTVTLTNDGNTTLHVTSASLSGDTGFSLSSDTCSGATLAPGAACTLQVGFSPANLGTFHSTLSFADDASNAPQTVAVSGNGVMPAVSLSASSLAFGNQVVGTRSATQAVVISNNGTDTLNVGAATASAPFVMVSDGCSNSAVTAGSSCTIQVAYAPTATGPSTGTLSIPDDAPGSPQTVALTGTGVQPQATVTPASLSFGSVRVGPGSPSAQQLVTIKNTGTSTLHVASITLAGNPAFTIGTGCSSTTLAPSASCTVGVYASPDTIGARTGSLQVADDAPASPQIVSLSVTGLDGRLSPSPTSVNFGTVSVNTKSVKVKITVTNTGNAVLNISHVSITGLNPGSFVIDNTNCNGAKLNPGATCNATVYFKPQAVGALSAALTFTNDGLGGTQSVPLSGTGK